MVHQTPLEVLQSACSTITDRQQLLCDAKLQLDSSEKAAREEVNSIKVILRNLADKISSHLEDQIRIMATRRRSELEDISSAYNCASPKLVQLFAAVKSDSGKGIRSGFECTKIRTFLAGLSLRIF